MDINDDNDLFHDVKGLLKRSIASMLKISKPHYDTSVDAQIAVDRCLTMIIAVGYNKTLDGALDDLCEWGSLLNANQISREIVQKEIMASLNTFRYEIAGFKKMHEMNQQKLEPKEIWKSLVSHVPVSADYDDEWLKQTTAKYQSP